MIILYLLVFCAGFARPPRREGRERRCWSDGESDIYLAVIHFFFPLIIQMEQQRQRKFNYIFFVEHFFRVAMEPF